MTTTRTCAALEPASLLSAATPFLMPASHSQLSVCPPAAATQPFRKAYPLEPSALSNTVTLFDFLAQPFLCGTELSPPSNPSPPDRTQFSYLSTA